MIHPQYLQNVNKLISDNLIILKSNWELIDMEVGQFNTEF